MHGVTSVPGSRHARAGLGGETGGVHSLSLIFERLVFLWWFSFKAHQTKQQCYFSIIYMLLNILNVIFIFSVFIVF